MDERFGVSFESPQSGWMAVGLRAGGGRRLLLSVSCAPLDSLRDLITGLCGLLAEGRAAEVRWNGEPEEYDFRIAPEADGRAEFNVTRYADHRRLEGRVVFSHRAPALDLCLAFWRELRQLRRRAVTDDFRQNWRRDFPHQEMRELTRLLRLRRREARGRK